jgi:Protein of unknown function (DUF3617).
MLHHFQILPRFVALSFALWIAAMGSSRAVTLKPGLWDYSVQTSTNGAPPVDFAQMMHNVPPAMKAEIEAGMKARGMAMDLGNNTLRLCLSPKFVAAKRPPLKLNGQCKVHWTQPAAGHWSFSYVCTQPTSSGKGSVTLASPTNYQTQFTAVTPQATIASSSAAHWVSSDCGGVPPLQPEP